MNAVLFYLFGTLTVIAAFLVVLNRNPIASALSLILCFLGLAGLFLQLEAFLIGTLQVLVYAGAVMVLFLFILMLLDLKAEEERPRKWVAMLLGGALSVLFVFQAASVLWSFPDGTKLQTESPALVKTADGKVSESPTGINAVGRTLFGTYAFQTQIIGALLLVATIGVIVLSRRDPNSTPSADS